MTPEGGGQREGSLKTLLPILALTSCLFLLVITLYHGILSSQPPILTNHCSLSLCPSLLLLWQRRMCIQSLFLFESNLLSIFWSSDSLAIAYGCERRPECTDLMVQTVECLDGKECLEEKFCGFARCMSCQSCNPIWHSLLCTLTGKAQIHISIRMKFEEMFRGEGGYGSVIHGKP